VEFNMKHCFYIARILGIIKPNEYNAFYIYFVSSAINYACVIEEFRSTKKQKALN